jgi:hypothetical protein
MVLERSEFETDPITGSLYHVEQASSLFIRLEDLKSLKSGKRKY